MAKKCIWASIILVLALIGCEAEPEQQRSGTPPPVVVATPLVKQVVEWDEYTGRFQAVDRVEIRARVNGYLNAIEFEDGQIVEQGSLLFVIDQRPFRIALQSAQAQYTLAEKEFNRAQELVAERAISQELFDQRQQELTVARATLDRARLDLEFTEVRAPITGRISTERVSIGNLVNANDTLLTTIVSQDPIYFVFNASERALLKYIRLDRSGDRPGSQNNPNPIWVKLFDEDTFRHEGKMDFVDNEVDLGTGTITGRAIFDNPDQVIYPGLTGRARLIGRPAYEALLVPDEAIGTDQSRKFVLTLNENDEVMMSFVTLGPVRESGLRIIYTGLDAEQRVIINGLQRARPGSKVSPQLTEITEQDNGQGNTVNAGS